MTVANNIAAPAFSMERGYVLEIGVPRWPTDAAGNYAGWAATFERVMAEHLTAPVQDSGINR